jgi:predicted molibdopterin-dependent oxidoreductase YjgC
VCPGRTGLWGRVSFITLNAMMKLILDEGLEDEKFIEIEKELREKLWMK